MPVRTSSIESPGDASCSAPTSGRPQNTSRFPSQKDFVLVFQRARSPSGPQAFTPTHSPGNSPEDPPILPIDSAIEPVFVHDWRMIQEHRGKGDSIDPQVERAVRIGLLRFGHRYLTRQARDARAAGRALPTDPYMRNWYDEGESEILRDVGGQDLLRHAYGPFSEWHHWRVGGIGRLVSFDDAARRFTMSASRQSDVATATACGFQCLWQTMQLLNARCRLGWVANYRPLTSSTEAREALISAEPAVQHRGPM